MILLKSFFRKVSSKIYLCIYSVLIITLIILFTFINFYTNIVNELFQKKSFMLLNSTSDYYDEINKYNNIKNIERVLLFQPNTYYDTLNFANYSYYQNGIVTNYTNSENNIGNIKNKYTWEDFIFSSIGSVLIFSDENINLTLNNGEISLSPSSSEYINDAFYDLINKKIAFDYNDTTIEFTIKDYQDSNRVGMTISKEDFNRLIDNDSYIYMIIVDNYSNANEITKELKKNDEIEVELFQSYSGDDAATVSMTNELIYNLELITYLIIFIFIIIFIIVTINIIKDENKNINIERLLGFNKRQIKKYMMLKLFTLGIISLLISTIISIIINYFITINSGLELKILDTIILLPIYSLVLIVNFLLSLIIR